MNLSTSRASSQEKASRKANFSFVLSRKGPSVLYQNRAPLYLGTKCTSYHQPPALPTEQHGFSFFEGHVYLAPDGIHFAAENNRRQQISPDANPQSRLHPRRHDTVHFSAQTPRRPGSFRNLNRFGTQTEDKLAGLALRPMRKNGIRIDGMNRTNKGMILIAFFRFVNTTDSPA